MSMLTLKRHQRRLVNHFPRYKIEDPNPIVGEKVAHDPTHGQSVHDSQDDISGPFITRTNTYTGQTVRISSDQSKLLQEISDHFDPNTNIADLLIMHEITGYKVVNENSREFWDEFATDRVTSLD